MNLINSARKVSPSDVSSIKKNYVITFTGKHGKTPLVIDNKTHAGTVHLDVESGEAIQFFFAMITKKGHEGDLKLGRMCLDMDAAGVYHTTYDAKSGSNFRITRVGCSIRRLRSYASATSYNIGFQAEVISKEFESHGLKLENPDYARDWYEPYEHLSGPYDDNKSHLYRDFESRDKFMIFKGILTGSNQFRGDAKGCGIDLLSLDTDNEDNKFCLGVFPIHDIEAREKLANDWLPISWPSQLPITDIKNYFGEEIGFYFAFLKHLVTGLIPLAPVAAIGQITSLVLIASGRGKNMIPEAVVSLVATGYLTLVLDKWVCEEARLAHLWECYGCRKELPPRPGFVGVVLKNPISGKVEFDFPSSERASRERKTILISLGMVFVLAATVLGIFVYKYTLSKSGASNAQLLIPSIINSFQITIFGAIYNVVAEWMTTYENHKTVSDHNSALFKRLTMFYFINYYATLFYIAFIKRSVEGCFDPISGEENCGRELSLQVFMVFVVNDFGNRVFNSVVQPYVIRRYKRHVIEADSSLGEMGPIEAQFKLLAKYDTTSALVLDYIELFIQWGYLVLFSSACPIVLILAIAVNYIETRTDGYKLLYEFRRVLPNRVDGIGEPLIIFVFTLRLGVLVNAGLLVYTYETFDFLPQEAQIWVFISLIALLFTVVVLIETAYPEVPRNTEVQIGRQGQIHSRLVLQHEADGQNLEFDDSMLGKTQVQIKQENPEEALTMGITEHDEDGVELARIVAKMVEDQDHEKPIESEFNPFSPKGADSAPSSPERETSFPTEKRETSLSMMESSVSSSSLASLPPVARPPF